MTTISANIKSTTKTITSTSTVFGAGFIFVIDLFVVLVVIEELEMISSVPVAKEDGEGIRSLLVLALFGFLSQVMLRNS